MRAILKNSAQLLSANVVAQAIGLAVYPILTRLYSPADFGVLNLFLSIGGILAMVAVAEYYYAIVLPKDDTSANAVIQTCIFLLGAMVLVLVLTVPFASSIAGVFKTPQLADYWWLMPLFVALTGLWNILNYWYIRNAEFKRVGGYQVSQSVLSAGCKLGFGYAGFLQGGLIFSMVIAPCVSTLLSMGLAWKKCLNRLHILPWSACRQVAHEYRNFPLFTLPKSAINLLFGYLPVLLLTPLFGAYEVGLWTMALLLGFAPISMITKSLYQSLFEQVSSMVKQKMPICPLFRHFTMWTLTITTPLFTGLYFVLPWLVGWLLGQEWSTSGLYIRWMLPWVTVSLLTSSCGFLADIFFEQKRSFFFEILLAVLRLLGVGIGVWKRNFAVAIAGYCLGSAVANAAQYIWLMSLTKHYESKRYDA